jgi:transposase
LPSSSAAKAVFPFRQGHKTDQNDALAVAEAAGRPNAKLAPLKTVEQQGMQAIQRSRELLVHERVSLSNHLRGLLMEFGIVIPQGFATLYRLLQQLLVTGIALSSERILAVTLGRLAPVTQAPGIDTQLFGYQNIGDAWFVSSS